MPFKLIIFAFFIVSSYPDLYKTLIIGFTACLAKGFIVLLHFMLSERRDAHLSSFPHSRQDLYFPI